MNRGRGEGGWVGPGAVHSLPRVPPRYRFQNAGSVFIRPVSRAVPVSSRARSVTGPNGSLRGGAPSSGIAYAQVRYVSGWPVAETARTSPAAVQPVTLVLASLQYVSRPASLPSGSAV